MQEDDNVQHLLDFASARATKIMADDYTEDDGDPPSLQDAYSVSTVDSESSWEDSPTGIPLPTAAQVPSFEDVWPASTPIQPLPAPIQALHHLPLLLRELGTSAIEFYNDLAVTDSIIHCEPSQSPC